MVFASHGPIPRLNEQQERHLVTGGMDQSGYQSRNELGFLSLALREVSGLLKVLSLELLSKRRVSAVKN